MNTGAALASAGAATAAFASMGENNATQSAQQEGFERPTGDAAEGEERQGRERRSRDRYGRDRRERGPRDEQAAMAEPAQGDTASYQQNLPLASEAPAQDAADYAASRIPVAPPVARAAAMPAAPAATPAAPTAVQAQAAVAPALPVVQSYALPIADLVQVASGSGLEWVNSDATKIAAVQAAIAAEPAPIRVPRERPAPVVIDAGPLVLVETKRDLRNVQLPFDLEAQAQQRQ